MNEICHIVDNQYMLTAIINYSRLSLKHSRANASGAQDFLGNIRHAIEKPRNTGTSYDAGVC